MSAASLFLTEASLPIYLKALENRDLETIDKFYNEDLLFIMGHNTFGRIATISLLHSTKEIMLSKFHIHNVAGGSLELVADITEEIKFLRDSDFLHYCEVKRGEILELKTKNRYVLKQGKISEIHREVLSIQKFLIAFNHSILNRFSGGFLVFKSID